MTSVLTAFYISNILADISRYNFAVAQRRLLYLGLVYAITLANQWLQFHVKQKIEKTVRTDIKQKLLNGIFDSFPQSYKGDDSARITETLYVDVNNITTFLFSSSELLTSIIYIAVTGGFLFRLNASLMMMLTGILLLVSGFQLYSSSMIKKINIDLRKSTDVHFKLTRDILKNSKQICVSNAAPFHLNRYVKNLNEVKKTTLLRDKKAWALNYIGTIFEYCWAAAFLLLNLKGLDAGYITISSFMLFFSYSRIYSSSVTGLLQQCSQLQQLLVSIERVFDLAYMYQAANGSARRVPMPLPIKSIRISDLGFSYGTKNVIQNLDEKIDSNFVQIIGRNGAGKTTLLNLISGILTAQKGTIFFGETPISCFSYREICENVTFVMQDDVIFDMSIRENILSFSGGDKITSVELYEACNKVGILDDILALERGFDTQISEVADFSFGQKKKILLARAYLKPSQIVLFDEPLQGLDSQSQDRIIDFIRSIGTTKHVFVSTHRPEQFKFCKHVIVLCDTRVDMLTKETASSS